MTVLGFDHIQLAIPVGGDDAARRFFGECLGLTELPKPPELAKRGGLWFQCGNIQLHLGIDPNFKPAIKTHPGFLVERLEPVVSALQASGYQVEHDPVTEGFTRMLTSDPFGNRIELLERL